MLICLPLAAIADCDVRAEADPNSYQNAVVRVSRLRDFRAWSEDVRKRKPGVLVAFGSTVDKQELANKKCHWSVTVYSVENSHLSRWKTFLVPLEGGEVVARDDANGVLVPKASVKDSALRRDTASTNWLKGLTVPQMVFIGIFMLGGVLSFVMWLARRARSQQRPETELGRLGAQISPSAEVDLEASLRRDFPDRNVYLQNVLRKDLGDLRIILAKASTAGTIAFDGDTTQSSTQTAAYYESGSATFPRFTVWPTNLMLRMAAGILKMGLRFPRSARVHAPVFRAGDRTSRGAGSS
jgi:hypothetical protein